MSQPSDLSDISPLCLGEAESSICPAAQAQIRPKGRPQWLFLVCFLQEVKNLRYKRGKWLFSAVNFVAVWLLLKGALFGCGTTQSFCGAAPTLLPGGGQKLTLSQKHVPGVSPVMKEAGEGRCWDYIYFSPPQPRQHLTFLVFICFGLFCFLSLHIIYNAKPVKMAWDAFLRT